MYVPAQSPDMGFPAPRRCSSIAAKIPAIASRIPASDEK